MSGKAYKLLTDKLFLLANRPEGQCLSSESGSDPPFITLSCLFGWFKTSLGLVSKGMSQMPHSYIYSSKEILHQLIFFSF